MGFPPKADIYTKTVMQAVFLGNGSRKVGGGKRGGQTVKREKSSRVVLENYCYWQPGFTPVEDPLRKFEKYTLGLFLWDQVLIP